ncbi:CHAT domain-containing protein [Lusitaniella coriacea]|uniref:CHAT domain-containing protein n=1 Tax=Lusitaniella coriacea TaxID=1983105 RepID=UPI003CE94768
MSQSFSRVRNAVALFVLSLLWVSVPVLVFEDARSVQAQTIDEREAEANRLLRQGVQQAQRSQLEVAIQSFQQALQLYQELEDRRGEGYALGNLGIAYNSLRQYEKAIEFYQQALAIRQELSDLAGEEKFLGNLGDIYYSLGEYKKAIDFYQESLVITQELGNLAEEGKALNDIGRAYSSLGQYEQAIDFYQQSLNIQREIEDRIGESQSLGLLGIAYFSLGQYEEALELYQQSLTLAREIRDPRREFFSVGNLAIAYASLGRYEQAIELYQKSLNLAQEIGSTGRESFSLIGLGNTYRSLEKYEKAIEFYQKALAIIQEIDDCSCGRAAISGLGHVYHSLGQYEKAVDFFQQFLTLAREISSISGESSALNNLGLVLYESSQFAQAEQTLFEAIQILESIRAELGEDKNRVSIFERQAKTYQTLQQVLIAQNKRDRALEIAERGRARAFVELLSQRISPETSPEPPTIEQIKQIAQNQNATLVEYSIIVDELDIDGKKEWRESQLYIWVVKPTGEVSFRTADLTELSKKGESLKKLVTRSRNSIGVRNRSLVAVRAKPDAEEPVNRLRQLHQILIEPIADLLPADPQEKVIFMPQGALFLAPFPALQDENENYLIEKHTILTAPAIQVLQLTREQRSRGAEAQGSRGGVLIVGNPTMPSVAVEISEMPTKLNPLPGSEREAKKIAEFLNTTPLIGDRATRQAVLQQMSNANIIHLATHGLLDDFKGQGVPGAIALAPDGTGERNDGLLTANEILNLNLNAELVVLSACDTGRGDITGDGVIGLSRSLVLAGVPSILVSLWAVDDHSTAFLMSEFYKNWQETGDKAQSLRQAMLATMEEYPKPIDWAAFTLIGESE